MKKLEVHFDKETVKQYKLLEVYYKTKRMLEEACIRRKLFQKKENDT